MKIPIEELFKKKKERKVADGSNAYNMNGNLILIYPNGRNEMIVEGKVGFSRKGLIIEKEKVVLIDVGIGEAKR
ncbi:MAG: hypothetical protein ACTSWD_04780 [Candidatus Heimdallarchaeota archaeon]